MLTGREEWAGVCCSTFNAGGAVADGMMWGSKALQCGVEER
jgi:hypothetical protein